MHNKASLALGVAIMIVAGVAIFSAWGWPAKAALFPLVIAIPLFFLATAEVVWALLGSSAKGASDFKLSDHLPQAVALRRTLLAAGWILGFFATIVLLGFMFAIPVFMLAYLRVQGGRGWPFSAIFTAVVSAVFYGLFDLLLHLPFPAGVIPEALGLG